MGAAFSASLFMVSDPAVSADFTAKDAQVLGRTLSYVGDGMAGVAVVGIVLAPGSPASQQDAELVRAAIGEGLSAGRVKLETRLVLVDQLSSVSGINAFFVTLESAGYPSVMLAAQRLHVPVISTDMACAERAACVVSFSSEPTVQIVISRAAADRTGVRFTQAFRMLVTER